jgi:hypothetical protein
MFLAAKGNIILTATGFNTVIPHYRKALRGRQPPPPSSPRPLHVSPMLTIMNAANLDFIRQNKGTQEDL